MVDGFRTRLAHAIDQSRYRGESLRSLARSAEVGEGTISNILNNDALDTSKSGPGLFAMARLAKELGTSLDFLGGLTPNPLPQTTDPRVGHVLATLQDFSETKSGQTLSAGGLLALHARSGGDRRAFANILDNCDEYEAPAETSQNITVLRVGPKSLAALTMGEPNPTLLQTALNLAPKELRNGWIADYGSAARRGTLATVESLDQKMQNHPVRVKIDFIRILLRVTDNNDRTSILNFSLSLS